MLHTKTTIRAQPPDFVNSVDVLASLVPIEAHQYPLPHLALNEPVHEEEHHPKQVEGFTDKLLALHDLEHVFEGELDEDSPLNFLDEAAETLVVGDDGWVMVEVQSKRR